MHKFTIFTVVFAVLMLSVVTELALSQFKASSFLVQIEQRAEQTVTKQEESLLKDSLNEDLNSTQVALAAPIPEVKQKSITDVFRPKSKFIMFIPSLYLDALNYFEIDFDGNIFSTIDSSNLNANTIYNIQLLQNNNEVAIVNELHFDNTSQSQLAFNIIQATASSYNQVATNVTNEFGSESFYINNPSKVDRAFLVIRHEKIIYALNYQRDIHSPLKEFYETLLK
jgi:hypothetical protein